MEAAGEKSEGGERSGLALEPEASAGAGGAPVGDSSCRCWKEPPPVAAIVAGRGKALPEAAEVGRAPTRKGGGEDRPPLSLPPAPPLAWREGAPEERAGEGRDRARAAPAPRVWPVDARTAAAASSPPPVQVLPSNALALDAVEAAEESPLSRCTTVEAAAAESPLRR